MTQNDRSEPVARQSAVLSMGDAIGFSFVVDRHPARGESSFGFVLEPRQGVRPTMVHVHAAPRLSVDGEVELRERVASWQIVGGYAEQVWPDA
jgi:hypothetical protein